MLTWRVLTWQSDEAFVIPVLQRFDGVPVVDEEVTAKHPPTNREKWKKGFQHSKKPKKTQKNPKKPKETPKNLRLHYHPNPPPPPLQGRILYRFPAFQRSAVDWLGRRQVAAGRRSGGGAYFAERRWQFSLAAPSQKFLAAALGVGNLVGVIWLSTLLRCPKTRPIRVRYVSDTCPIRVRHVSLVDPVLPGTVPGCCHPGKKESAHP